MAEGYIGKALSEHGGQLFGKVARFRHCRRPVGKMQNKPLDTVQLKSAKSVHRNSLCEELLEEQLQDNPEALSEELQRESRELEALKEKAVKKGAPTVVGLAAAARGEDPRASNEMGRPLYWGSATFCAAFTAAFGVAVYRDGARHVAFFVEVFARCTTLDSLLAPSQQAELWPVQLAMAGGRQGQLAGELGRRMGPSRMLEGQNGSALVAAARGSLRLPFCDGAPRPSQDIKKGERFFEKVVGICVRSDEMVVQVGSYMRYAPLFQGGVFWATQWDIHRYYCCVGEVRGGPMGSPGDGSGRGGVVVEGMHSCHDYRATRAAGEVDSAICRERVPLEEKRCVDCHDGAGGRGDEHEV